MFRLTISLCFSLVLFGCHDAPETERAYELAVRNNRAAGCEGCRSVLLFFPPEINESDIQLWLNDVAILVQSDIYGRYDDEWTYLVPIRGPVQAALLVKEETFEFAIPADEELNWHITLRYDDEGRLELLNGVRRPSML